MSIDTIKIAEKEDADITIESMICVVEETKKFEDTNIKTLLLDMIKRAYIYKPQNT